MDLGPIFSKLLTPFDLKKTGQLYVVQRNYNGSFSYINPLIDDLNEIAPLYFKEITSDITLAQSAATNGRSGSIIYDNYKGISSIGTIGYIPEVE